MIYFESQRLYFIFCSQSEDREQPTSYFLLYTFYFILSFQSYLKAPDTGDDENKGKYDQNEGFFP
jgi:hypothetical protein